MTFLTLALAQVALGQSPAPGPELDANPLYRTVLTEGLVVGGVTVKLPPPCLREGMTEAERRAALKAVVDLPLDEFLRDSVNAPFKLKIRDVPYPGGVVHVVDIWFAIHADLDEINLADLSGKKDQSGSGEAGNMKFSVRTLTDDELKARSKVVSGGLDRYVLNKGVLLDRVKLSSVNHILGSKAGGALVVASMTDPAFQKDDELANYWVPIPEQGEAKKDPGTPRIYEGSAGYSRIGRYSEKPSVLLVEAHLAFAEPKAWFNGSSILRSKIGLVAQDQIRSLRREVLARRKKEGKPEGAKP
jgi:hypothetical protein